MSKFLVKYNGYFYYRRRVPAHLAAYDKRKVIKISLKTKEESLAAKRAIFQNDKIEKFWESLVHNPSLNQDEDMKQSAYRNAVVTARAHGFEYREAEDLVQSGDIAEVYERLKALDHPEVRGNTKTAKALLGTTEKPIITLSQAIDIYVPNTLDRVRGKTEQETRKWLNPRKKAINSFTKFIGDLPIKDITRMHFLKFREHWMQRVAENGLHPTSANKDFMHLKDILSTVSQATDAGIDFAVMLADIKLRGDVATRASFEASFVQEMLSNHKSFENLNDDATALIYFMADTGARPKEIVGLRREDIVLDVPIPYIFIRPTDERNLKTNQSERQIPLVGFSLEIAKKMPNGITRYTNPDSVSNLVNKFCRNNHLFPSPQHSLYSLRHTFKDRLRDCGAPEEVIDNLMGHKTRGPKYGRGHILETKKKWLDKIAFKTD